MLTIADIKKAQKTRKRIDAYFRWRKSMNRPMATVSRPRPTPLSSKAGAGSLF